MGSEVLVALIMSLGAVCSATVAAVASVRTARKVTAVREDTSAVRDQVENDHDSNMRQESDNRHEETRGFFTDVSARLVNIARDIGGIRGELRDLRAVDSDQAKKLDDHLEWSRRTVQQLKEKNE